MEYDLKMHKPLSKGKIVLITSIIVGVVVGVITFIYIHLNGSKLPKQWCMEAIITEYGFTKCDDDYDFLFYTVEEQEKCYTKLSDCIYEQNVYIFTFVVDTSNGVRQVQFIACIYYKRTIFKLVRKQDILELDWKELKTEE